MYNTDLPTRAELPSAIKLMQSTILAAIVALTLLITVVMPSEYGIDPTGVGRLLGLKQMGEIKTQLAEEADADNQASAVQQGPGAERSGDHARAGSTIGWLATSSDAHHPEA